MKILKFKKLLIFKFDKERRKLRLIMNQLLTFFDDPSWRGGGCEGELLTLDPLLLVLANCSSNLLLSVPKC